MSERKHSPLPWVNPSHIKEDDLKVFADDQTKYHRSVKVCETEENPQRPGLAKANAEFIVKACNAYYPHIEALEKAIDLLQAEQECLLDQDDAKALQEEINALTKVLNH